MGQRKIVLRVAAFDLGVQGAIFRAGKDENGEFIPLSCEKWKFKGTDDERYNAYAVVAGREIEWADAIGYEHVQFNRGKSLIEGMRGILISKAHEEDKLCVGVNVATLKKFAIKGRWSDGSRNKAGKKHVDGKKKMELALSVDYPEFISFMDGDTDSRTISVTGKRDDIIDAAWVAIWLLENAEIL